MKKRLPIRWALVVCGLFFFVNPNYSVIDVLPDFIGAALIVLGTLHLAEIDERAKSAKKAFLILALVNAVKTLSFLLLTDSDGTVWSLTFTFVFGLGEGCLFGYGMCKLFDAVSYKAMRCDCEELCKGFTALKGMTILIAILKNLLPVLPELTLLSTDYGEVVIGAAGGEEVSAFVYKALMILNIVVVVLYGAGWWVYMFRYFRKIGRQSVFLERLEKQYTEEVGSKHQVLTYRALKTAGLLLTVGLLFALPLRLDGTDYLPDFAAGVFFLLAMARLLPLYRKECKKALVAGAVYTAAALAEWVYELIFNSGLSVDHDAGYYVSVSSLLLRHPNRLFSYYGLVGVSIFKYIALAVFFFFLSRVFMPIVRDHTGAPYELSGTLGREKDREIKKRLNVLCKVLFGVGTAAAGAGIFYRVFRMFSGSIPVQYTEIVFGVFLVGFYLYFHTKLEEGIDNKYYFAE